MEVGVQDISITVNPPQNVTVDVASGGVTSMPVSSVGGPKGDDGYTPQKNVDYFDGTNGTDGTDGTDGREVELQNNGTYIQWRYTGDSWSDLVALASLRGADGTDGVDGEEVSLQVSGGYIQWRLGTGSWINLIALSALAGADGREVEMRNSGTYIQWRYVGDPTWTDIVALSTLKGDKGDIGISVPTGGTTGQTLLKNSSTDYDYSWATLPTAPVVSVAGKTGAVTLAKADVGLGSADNTSDLAKPISTATQTALDTKDKAVTEVTVATARATAAKVGTTTGGAYTPTVGDRLNVRFTLGISVANPTLNIDGSGAKNIRIGDVNVSTTTLTTGAVSTTIPLWYDGTYYQAYGSMLNTNSTYNSMTGSTTAVTASTGTLAVDRYTIANYTSGKLMFTLPATAVVGSIIEVFGLSAGGYRITAPSGDNILYPDGTDSGSAGYIEAPRNTTVTLRCVVANTTWAVTGTSLLITNNNGKTMPTPPSW